MAWTKPQRNCFMRACAIAAFTDEQRYIVMRHCGCPLDAKTKRPSIAHHGNDHRAFERCMAVAERHAAGRCAFVDPPRGQSSWSDSALKHNARTVRAIANVAAELERRIASKFSPGFLFGFIERQTFNDGAVTLRPTPKTLSECDEGQLYRIFEGLKAWGGREMIDRGLRPESFVIPPHVR
jgi:hypothetical protein